MDSILCSRFAASAAARAFWISGKKSLYQIITPMTMPTWIMITLVRMLPKPNRTRFHLLRQPERAMRETPPARQRQRL